MQEEGFDLFDDRVRSLLDGAEVKAPRGVWRAVRGSLDAAASWWRWAACGLVAASLLAGGLFIGGVFDRNDDITAGPMLAQAGSDMDDPMVEEPAVSEVAPAELPCVAKVRVARVADAASAVEPVTATAGATVTEPVAGPEETAGETSQPSSVQPSVPAGQWSDPFAAMDLEDRLAARSRSRVSLALLGVAGGNDSDLGTYLGRSARMADGSDAAGRTGITEKSASAYGIPISVGLGVRYNFNDRISLGTGLTWSLLHRTFTGVYNGTTSIEGDVDHDMHYVGIPLNLYFNAVNTGGLKVYAFGGGSAEYCVSNRYVLHDGQNQMKCSEAVKGLQYSVSAGLGIEFRLADRLGVYFDPSARYYPHSDHPRSIRTDKPFMVNFEAGLRLNL